MTTTITAENGIELEVCNLGVSIVDHDEQWKGWARLGPEQRRVLADALDPGRVPAWAVSPDGTPRIHTAGRWTRDDLLSAEALNQPMLELSSPVNRLHFILDELVDHLNAYHPKPGTYPSGSQADTLARERAAAVTRAEQAERRLGEENQQALSWLQIIRNPALANVDRQEGESWVDAADRTLRRLAERAARPASAVSRADIERAIRGALETSGAPWNRRTHRLLIDAMQELIQAAHAVDPVEETAQALWRHAHPSAEPPDGEGLEPYRRLARAGVAAPAEADQ